MAQTRSLISLVRETKSMDRSALKAQLKRYIGDSLERLRTKLDIPKQSDVIKLAEKLESIDEKLKELEKRRRTKSTTKTKPKAKKKSDSSETKSPSKSTPKKPKKKTKSTAKTNAALT